MGQSWGDAFAELSAARQEGRLAAADLERLAVAAYMLGRDDDCATAWIDAHREWLRLEEPERAAGCAFWHAIGLFFRGDLAPALGWVARGRRILEDSDAECVERAWLAILTALPSLFGGDADTALPSLVDGEQLARRLGDTDAVVFARLCRGYALILQGELDDGMALLDEVMAAVTADEVSPVVAGIAYCQVIALCHTVFDLGRARSGPLRSSRWCDTQPDLVPFRGNCLVHRCEIFQLQGAWHAQGRGRTRAANGSPALRPGTRSARRTTSLARSSGCAGSSAPRKSRTGRRVSRGGSPSPGCRCCALPRAASSSPCPRSGGSWRKRRRRSSDRACSPPTST